MINGWYILLQNKVPKLIMHASYCVGPPWPYWRIPHLCSCRCHDNLFTGKCFCVPIISQYILGCFTTIVWPWTTYVPPCKTPHVSLYYMVNYENLCNHTRHNIKRILIFQSFNYLHRLMWGDFLSFHSRFYKVIMHESTNATNEGKIQV